MGNTITRNAFKGYGYQKWVYLNFVYKMDLNNKITYIDAEISRDESKTTKFDDIILKDIDNNTYYIQAKDYENFNIDNVSIKENKVKIKGYEDIPFKKEDTNIVVFQSNFECDNEILGIKAKLIDSVYFIPLTIANSEKQIGRYFDINREKSVHNLIYNNLHNGQFEFHKKNLPPYTIYPIKLNQKTILLRKIPDENRVQKGVHWCIGPPGIGKSHLVSEFEDKYENTLIYRFHIGNDDLYKDDRVVFYNFLQNLSCELFKNSSLHSQEEIIQKLEESNRILLIDGLDHVENYREDQLEFFINFIECLDNTKTIIFSRPLRNYSEMKNKHTIRNWFKDETYYYLNEEYPSLNDYYEKLYDVTAGYPIIIYYLAEHIKNGGDLSEYSEKIESINDYYDKIIRKIKYKNLLKIFLTIPSYVLTEEISSLLDEDNSEMLFEFIEEHPYLFNSAMNRLNLFHDSFNNYLRIKLDASNRILDRIKENILSINIEYLSRFHTIDFQDEEFVKEVLRKYSNFETFKELSSNFDFESVKIFYLNLRKILKGYPNTLNIYQYYSFILIYMIVDRNDYFDNFSLFYQIFRYADWNGYNESDIYSNGVMWSLYQYYKEKNVYSFEKLLENEYYDEEELIQELNREWDIEKLFYSEEDCEIADENVIEDIIRYEFNYRLLEDYLAYVWINNCENSKYYPFIDNFVNKSWNWSDDMEFNKILDELKIRTMPARNILNGAKLRIYQCGYLEDENIYLKSTLSEHIKNNLNKMSCDLYIELLGYLRFNNTLKVDFDYSEIFKYFNMYSFHKDYSVETLDTALLIFEKHGCILEEESMNLILNTMNKSEKGIHHLSLDYIAEKAPDKIERILDSYDLDFDSQIGYLDEDKINKFPEKIVFKNFFKFNSSREIDFNNINHILKSNYKKQLLLHLKFLKLRVYNVPNGCIQFFEENDIMYEKCKDDDRIPDESDKTILERGYLKSNDLDEIKLEGLTHLDLARLQNGNHDCMTYPDLFKIYDDEIIKEDFLLIIHDSITTNVYFSDKFFANMYYCLGNIPYLINQYNIEIDWNNLFYIFKTFIEESCIPF
ncbi:AAA family ATPase [uncultured Methanobrevibacter sp.]|uniref:AAA family ATPase n=1 Tax=uncultured Methanobrevibacter sp. TaxID=253161 RepID=UPI0025ED800C|nr:AAA family ATPase [uncultured Methanobrevibacter sp.]